MCFRKNGKGCRPVEGWRKYMKKKILVITNHSYMLWQFRRELIAELSKEYEVILSMPFVGHEADFQAMGLRCVETKLDRRGINPKTDLKLLKFYDYLIQKEKPELVITYSIKPNIYAGLVCSFRKIPYCVNVQGLGTAFEKPLLAGFVSLLYKAAFRHVSTVFFENEANAAEFRKRKLLTKERQTILPGAGVNLTFYEQKPYPEHSKLHFLYLGRIMKEKGMDELFGAVRLLKEEGADFVLELVGFFEEEYEEQVEELKNAGIVRFHGFSEDPRPYYEASDCVVLPSYHEGMSNVLLEASAVGRMLITSDIPGCREAVEDGTTGFLVKAKDQESLYQAMKRTLEMSAEERAAMGSLGRRKMEREFCKEMVVEKTIRALEVER